MSTPEAKWVEYDVREILRTYEHVKRVVEVATSWRDSPQHSVSVIQWEKELRNAIDILRNAQDGGACCKLK